MVSKTVILFLMVAVASGRIVPQSHQQMVIMPSLSGCPPSSEPAPIICRFMQPGFHYKPQLIEPSTYIPPLVVEKCDHPELEIELPAPEKPIVIPEAPILPPITIPKFPVPVILEEAPMPVVEPCEPAFVAPEVLPIMPVLPVAQPEPCLIEEVPEFHQPIIVPQPPELPPFVMPEMPAVIVPVVEPCLEDQAIPIAPTPEYKPPMPLPIVPEIPVLNIPSAPELPPLEMPILPEIVVQAEPCIQEVMPEIPQAIELPEMPVRIEVPMAELCIEDHPMPAPMPEYIPLPAPLPEYIPLPAPMPMPVEEPCETAFKTEMPKIPMAPELPPFVMPALPEIIAHPEPMYKEVTPAINYGPLVVPAHKLPALMLPQLVREPAIVAPCPEDQVPVAIPEYIPELPKMPFFEPVHVLSKPEDPCITDQISLIVPQFPKLPEPIAIPVMPAAELKVDPCEPSAKPVMIPSILPSADRSELPYFVRHASMPIPNLPIDYSLFPTSYMRHH